MTRLLNRYALLWLALLLAGLAIDTSADISNEAKPDRIYDVEVILFRNEAVPRGRETVLPTPSPELPKGSFDFTNPASTARAAKAGFLPLAEEQLQLQAERKRLDQSRRYRVLLHFGWRQPGLAAKDARAIRVHGGRFYDNSYASIDEALRGNPAEPDDQGKARPQQGLFELEGWIRVSLSRYLHTEANLVLREPASEEQRMQSRDSLQSGALDDLRQKLLINYPLKEKRRMRSKRLHYLDHPEYGMLVLITPYQPAAEKSSNASNETAAPTAGQ